MVTGIAAERVVSVTEVAVTITCVGEVMPVGRGERRRESRLIGQSSGRAALDSGGQRPRNPCIQGIVCDLHRDCKRLAQVVIYGCCSNRRNNLDINSRNAAAAATGAALAATTANKKNKNDENEAQIFHKIFLSITGNSGLEAQFQSKLHGTRTVSIDRMQKRVAGQAVGLRIAGCVECLNSVATDRVIGAISEVRAGVVNPELSMVEDVENLRAKLEAGAFLHLEGFHQRHIEVPAAGVVEQVASGVAEGQSARRGECTWIAERRPKALRIVRPGRRRVVNVANDIRKRSDRGDAAGDTGVVGN